MNSEITKLVVWMERSLQEPSGPTLQSQARALRPPHLVEAQQAQLQAQKARQEQMRAALQPREAQQIQQPYSQFIASRHITTSRNAVLRGHSSAEKREGGLMAKLLDAMVETAVIVWIINRFSLSKSFDLIRCASRSSSSVFAHARPALRRPTAKSG